MSDISLHEGEQGSSHAADSGRTRSSSLRSRSPYRVLIFDDSDLCLAFGCEVLSKEGFEVCVARNLIEFDRALTEWQPDVILADVRMPEIDGSSLCKRLKQGFNTSRLPVVLFSNLRESELETIAEDCGADAYLSKNGGFDHLSVTISSLCEEILW
ncbi:response regulator [Haliangium sp.]|uniref:response regulator n=1 Tax=Haliangium sp. TaxID=2663208 RepID=UPI003D13C65C